LLLEEFFSDSFATELVIIGLLAWFGYIGARLVARFNLPAVTGFLIVGILLGPSVAGILSKDILHDIEFAEPLALGIIVFLIGEELTTRMLSRHRWQFWLTAALDVVLPASLVAIGVWVLMPGEPAFAWVLGAIALAGAPATIMAVMTEKRAKGRTCDMMLGVAALDNILSVLGFSVIVPYILFVEGVHLTATDAMMQTAQEVLVSIVIGVVFGFVLSALLKNVSDRSEMLALALAHIVLSLAAASVLGASTLLAPLVAGITIATLEERQEKSPRVFEALRSVEFPAYILFFTIAGANLELSAVVAGGGLVIVYIVMRSVGKFVAGFVGGMTTSLSPADSTWLGLGFLPQAGVAVGLALSAAQSFPEIGATINAVVLASIVFFELVGPIASGKAIERVCDPPPSDEVCIVPPGTDTILIPVSHAFSRERLLYLLETTSLGREEVRFVLTHIVSHARPMTRVANLDRGTRILDDLKAAAGEAGFDVDTRLVESTNVGEALSELAEELGSTLVVLGSGQGRATLTRSLLKSRMHRIIDEISAPVLIVPEVFPSRAAGAAEPCDDPESPPPTREDDDAISLEEPDDRPVP
jgi:Kef-type K+ transport system membrane component KefB